MISFGKKVILILLLFQIGEKFKKRILLYIFLCVKQDEEKWQNILVGM